MCRGVRAGVLQEPGALLRAGERALEQRGARRVHRARVRLQQALSHGADKEFRGIKNI